MKSRLLFSAVAPVVLAVGCAQSDAGITTSVKSRLAADDLVRARQIDVDTRDRVVTLTGEVRSAEEEAKALQIARDTNGVANVVDQLNVAPESGAAPTTGTGAAPTERGAGPLANDASITAAVKSKLLADPDTSALRIDVDTKDSMVTLTGTVGTEAEKKQAITIARNTEGVKNVTDRLKVGRRQ
jgi:hyperosmotically inducible protein